MEMAVPKGAVVRLWGSGTEEAVYEGRDKSLDTSMESIKTEWFF